MANRYSIAAARAQFPALVNAAESGAVVELTRRGRPVAAVVSIRALERLQGKAPFAQVYEAFVQKHGLDAGLDPSFSHEVRDRSEGRRVRL